MRLLHTALAAAALMAGSAAQSAIVINYPDFAATGGLTLNGAAAPVGSVLRVTPAQDGQAGSVFSTNAVSLAANASFSTFFQFRFTNPDTGFCDGTVVCGADGLVFVVQTVSNNVGGAGGGIGYFGIPRSLGIEFDTWNNGSGDRNSSNHVGVNVNGDMNSLFTAEVTEADMNSGDVWNAWVDYNGGSQQLEVRLGRSGARPAAALLSVVRDIAADLQATNAFVGFTSGTGSSNANHDLLSWQLDNSFAPINPGGGNTGGGGNTVPEPASLALALAALGLMAGIGRRSRR